MTSTPPAVPPPRALESLLCLHLCVGARHVLPAARTPAGGRLPRPERVPHTRGARRLRPRTPPHREEPSPGWLKQDRESGAVSSWRETGGRGAPRHPRVCF